MYPMSYDEFKNALLSYFVNEANNEQFYTKKSILEFVNNHNFDFHSYYELECSKYDDNIRNVFDDNEVFSDYMFYLDETCYMYCSEHDLLPEIEKVDESKYPMSYEEFMDILREKLLEDAVEYRSVPEEEAKKTIDDNFRPGTDEGYSYYLKSCKAYDEYKSEGDPVYKKIFTPYAINGYHTDGINNCQFWDYF